MLMHMIGTVLRSVSLSPGAPWFWSLTLLHLPDIIIYKGDIIHRDPPLHIHTYTMSCMFHIHLHGCVWHWAVTEMIWVDVNKLSTKYIEALNKSLEYMYNMIMFLLAKEILNDIVSYCHPLTRILFNILCASLLHYIRGEDPHSLVTIRLGSPPMTAINFNYNLPYDFLDLVVLANR